MAFEVKLGDTVVVDLVSDNGAAFPGSQGQTDGSTVITLASNAPEVATLAASVTVPTGQSTLTGIAVTLVAVGSADFTGDFVDTQGNPFHAAGTISIGPAPLPGFQSFSMSFRVLTPTPPSS